MVENFTTCTWCGGNLTRVSWNDATDVLYCDDVSCRSFHTPIVPPSTKPKPQKKLQIPAWFASDDRSYSARLYRARAVLEGDVDSLEDFDEK